jgi:hypothetical protein
MWGGTPHIQEVFKTFPDTKGNNIEQTALDLASLEYKISSTQVLCPHTLSRFPCIKYKGKVVPLHAMKAYRGNRGTAPLLLNLSSRWR